MATHAANFKVEGQNSGNSLYFSAMGFEDDFNPVNKGQTSVQEKGCNPAELQSDIPTKIVPAAQANVNTQVKMPGPVPCCPPSPLTCYALRLCHGNELRRTLLKFVEKHELKGAFILSCVGSAVSAKLRIASAKPQTEGHYMIDQVNPTEIVSLQGTLSGGGHLHVALSDCTGKVIGGHLMELIVDTTCEVVVGECSGLSFSRVFDESTGFNELVVNNR